MEIHGHGDGHERQARQLEQVPDPPPELVPAHGQRGHQRNPEHRDARHNGEVRAASGEEEGARRPESKREEQHEPGGQGREGLDGLGTVGTSSGTRMPVAPSRTIARRSTTCRRSSGFTALGSPRTGGTAADRASTAPPTGKVAAPENATTPLSPVSTSGVVSPWTASSA